MVLAVDRWSPQSTITEWVGSYSKTLSSTALPTSALPALLEEIAANDHIDSA